MHQRIKQLFLLTGVAGGLMAMHVFGSGAALKVKGFVVEPHQVQPMILASGQLDYVREVPLSSELVARVARIAVHEGDYVHAGQILLQLDSSTFEAEVAADRAQVGRSRIQVESAQLDVTTAERDFARKKELADAKFLVPSALDDAQQKLDAARLETESSLESLHQAEAALVLAKENLAKTVIRAPIDGTAVSLPIRVGEIAVPSASGIPGSVLMTIADTSAMHADVLVDEAEVTSVTQGQTVKVYPAGREDAPLEGHVTSTALLPNAGSHNYMVRVALDGPRNQLRAGMSCRVELLSLTRSPRLAIPLQAVQISDDADKSGSSKSSVTQVWVVENGHATRRAISLGASSDTYQEVLTGLKSGETILVAPIRALHALDEGEAVRVSSWKEDDVS